MRDGHSTELPDLPQELDNLIKGYSITRYPWYETGAEIYRLESKSDTLYLKFIEGVETCSLEHESKILEWINGRIPVPSLLYYGVKDGVEYQLTTEIKGAPTHDIQPHMRENAVKILGKSLRLIHSLDPDGCPFENTLDDMLSELQGPGILGEIYDETPVFTHGDYCLPNILLADGVLGGILDWDCAGVADPYMDFTSCIWSIGYNYGEEEANRKWVPLFFESYGIKPDEDKLRYYTKLKTLVP